jgi:dipeptidyl-peptidase 4
VPDKSNDTVSIRGTKLNTKSSLTLREKIEAKNSRKNVDDRTKNMDSTGSQKSLQLDLRDSGSKRDVILSNDNLWLKERQGSLHQLTWDASDQNIYDDIYISPDERFAIAWQYTPEQQHIVNRVESSPVDRLEPRLRSRQYLKPGD